VLKKSAALPGQKSVFFTLKTDFYPFPDFPLKKPFFPPIRRGFLKEAKNGFLEIGSSSVPRA
jgi:hypothetical protein